jgi:hypothetical protein
VEKRKQKGAAMQYVLMVIGEDAYNKAVICFRISKMSGVGAEIGKYVEK